jgi:hypothetical protein
MYCTVYRGVEYLKLMDLYCSQDGPMPILPGFYALEKMRKEELKEFFPHTSGLLSQGRAGGGAGANNIEISFEGKAKCRLHK